MGHIYRKVNLIVTVYIRKLANLQKKKNDICAKHAYGSIIRLSQFPNQLNSKEQP